MRVPRDEAFRAPTTAIIGRDRSDGVAEDREKGRGIGQRKESASG
jgi:hypothetical protein